MMEQQTVVKFTERTGIRKNGNPSIRTITHYWAICDVCAEGTWVLSSGLAKTKTDPLPGRKCRMTPKCEGKHRKPSLESGLTEESTS
jgi:hypothetical protein